MDLALATILTDDFDINGGGNCNVKLPKILSPLIDNPIFQRLRRIKQTGFNELVYPNATQTRFVHSIGTASLAFDFMKFLKSRHPDRVTFKDILCVTIAGLVHDLGHGPFSHLFEGVFSDADFCHENLSSELFSKILNDYPRVKQSLSMLNDNDIKLIKELINPSSEWFRTVESDKTFLFGIVSNPLNGLDVDKFEYMLRDSSHSGVPINFNKETISRLMSSAVIREHPDHGYSWIAFQEKCYVDVQAIFDTRKRLHRIVYSHRFCIIADEMIKKALRAAAPHLVYKEKNGNLVPLNECCKHLDAYILLDDSVYSQIIISPLDEMAEAQAIIRKLENRQIPKSVAKFDEIHPESSPNPSLKDVKSYLKKIETLLKAESYTSFAAEDIYVIMRTINAGKGDADPLPHVLFYTRTDPAQKRTFNGGDKATSKYIIFVYAPFECTDADAEKINGILKKFAKENGISPPFDMFKRKIALDEKEK